MTLSYSIENKNSENFKGPLASCQSLVNSRNKMIQKVPESSLDAYLIRLHEFPLLSHKEEIELFLNLKAGDESARTALIQANLRLVVSVCRRYRGQGLDLIDLIQEGNLGLMKAIDKFLPARGTRFSTYATWWIRDSITRALSNQSRTIRIPSHLTETMTRMVKAREAFKMKFQREPNLEELSKFTGIKAKKIRLALTVEKENVSLEAVDEDGRGTASEAELSEIDSSVEKSITNEHLLNEVNSLIDNLSERERDIICLRFGFLGQRKFSLKEIEDHLNLTKDQVQKASSSAMKKLKKLASLGSNRHLEDFLK